MSDAGSDTEKEQIPTLGEYHGDRNDALERHGKGTNVFPNGDVYDGMYQKGKRHGHGKYVWKATGARYIGEYLNNERNGEGEFVYPDGARYKGFFLNGKRNGQGTFMYPNGDIYDGDWQDDLKHGKGEYLFAQNGVKKRGHWVKGQLQGEGEIILADARLHAHFTANDTVDSKVRVTFPALSHFHMEVDAQKVGLNSVQVSN